LVEGETGRNSQRNVTGRGGIQGDVTKRVGGGGQVKGGNNGEGIGSIAFKEEGLRKLLIGSE